MADNHDSLSRTHKLGLMSGGIAHDLNNLLSPILLGVQTLQRNDPDDKTKRILSMIELSSRRAADLVRHLLDFSRKTRNEMHWTSLDDVERDVVQTAAGVENMHVDYLCNIHRPGFGILMSRAVAVECLTELLRNSQEASKASSSIRVLLEESLIDEQTKRSSRLARSGHFLRIEVTDEGEGMSDETMKHACDPFFTTRQQDAHAGLGLFFVHTLLRQVDGFIDIVSKPSGGCQVSMYIPMQESV